ncbi:MAG TPA: HDOD domain-containing protein, partial [Candidatus Dormibacteraeota bacterium]|nr:HDOD domain-containing protein [Candidatus Dormibacteraeota bacterium]
SIERALTVLGAVAVAGIAMVARLDGSLAPRDSSASALLHLRRHSLLTAVAAKALADRAADGIWDRESAFVLGLLHDLGWLVQLQTGSGRSPQRESAPAQAADCAEHALLSAALFAHWQLPAQFIDAVRDHHRLAGPDAPGGMLLALAEQCAVHAGDEFGPRQAPAQLQPSLALFGLTEADLARLGAQCAAEAVAIDALVH